MSKMFLRSAQQSNLGAQTSMMLLRPANRSNLSICRRLVQAMGGDLTLESELGRGSRFSFWIPREPPPNLPRPPAAAAAQKE
jgi:light-regulated signal transduction histidine kinase (bacteriophytochrome)